MDDPTAADGGSMADPGGTAEAAELRPTALARRLLAAVRADGASSPDPDPTLTALAAADAGALEPIRTDRRRALAFWLNLYNAGTQLLLQRRAELSESPLRLVRFSGRRRRPSAGPS